jgi:hypothetical protein
MTTSLQDWEDKWQMSFNAKKCQVIRITPKNRPPLPTTYKLHGHTLDTVATSKTLLQSLARWYLLVSLFPILMLFHGWLLWVRTRMIVFCGIHVEHWWGSCFCRNGPWCCCGLYAPVSYM